MFLISQYFRSKYSNKIPSIFQMVCVSNMDQKTVGMFNRSSFILHMLVSKYISILNLYIIKIESGNFIVHSIASYLTRTPGFFIHIWNEHHKSSKLNCVVYVCIWESNLYRLDVGASQYNV